MKKKAIILLITVGFITMMTALIFVSVNIFDTSIESVYKIENRNRFNALFTDIVAILDKKVKDITTSSKLDEFLGAYPPLSDSKSGLSISIEVEPKVNKININNLYYKHKVDFVTKAFLEKVFLKYEVADGDFLYRLFLDTIDRDESERGAQTEIVLKDFDFKNGKIENKKHLDKILDYYISVTGDKSVKEIPWEKLIFFGERDKKYILDCDRMEPELVETLFGERVRISCEDLQKAGISAFNYSPFKKGVDYPVTCKVYFTFKDREERVKFDYDLKTHKVSNIEKYF